MEYAKRTLKHYVQLLFERTGTEFHHVDNGGEIEGIVDDIQKYVDSRHELAMASTASVAVTVKALTTRYLNLYKQEERTDAALEELENSIRTLEACLNGIMVVHEPAVGVAGYPPGSGLATQQVCEAAIKAIRELPHNQWGWWASYVLEGLDEDNDEFERMLETLQANIATRLELGGW